MSNLIQNRHFFYSIPPSYQLLIPLGIFFYHTQVPTQQHDSGLSDLIQVVKSKKKESFKETTSRHHELSDDGEEFENEKNEDNNNNQKLEEQGPDAEGGWEIDDDILNTNEEGKKKQEFLPQEKVRSHYQVVSKENTKMESESLKKEDVF